VYVLDVFQKKSKKGAQTPPGTIDRIKKRLKAAAEHYERRRSAQ
jgi:phage-related protein